MRGRMTIFSFASDSAESDVRDPNRISASDADQLAYGEDDANHKSSKGTFTPDKVRFLRHVLEAGATTNEAKPRERRAHCDWSPII